MVNTYGTNATTRNRPQDWMAAMNMARHNGKRWLAKLDLLSYSLSLKGSSITKLRDDDPRLVKLRKEISATDGNSSVPRGTSRDPETEIRDQKIWKLRKRGYSLAYIANKVGVSKGSASNAVTQFRKRENDHTLYDQLAIVDMHNKGYSVMEIGAALGYGTKQVNRVIAHEAKQEKVSS